jgi:hypothetical protein
MIRFGLLTLLFCILIFKQGNAQTKNGYVPQSIYMKPPKDTSARNPMKPIEDCRFYVQFGAGYNFA